MARATVSCLQLRGSQGVRKRAPSPALDKTYHLHLATHLIGRCISAGTLHTWALHHHTVQATQRPAPCIQTPQASRISLQALSMGRRRGRPVLSRPAGDS